MELSLWKGTMKITSCSIPPPLHNSHSISNLSSTLKVNAMKNDGDKLIPCEKRKSAFLIGVGRKEMIPLSRSEITEIAKSNGLHICDYLYQNLTFPDPNTYVGSGKIKEVRKIMHRYDCHTLLTLHPLSERQRRNINEAIGEVQILDRTCLILDLMSKNATSSDEKLQLNSAKKLYKKENMSRRKVKMDMQAAKMRRNKQKDLRGDIPVVALVGSINSGKSTLFNQMTGSSVTTGEGCFATLDTIHKRVEIKKGINFLLMDTLSFISEMPPEVLDGFQLSIDELSASALILHVVDLSHALAFEHIEIVDKVLTHLKLSSIPKLILWNKVDKLTERSFIDKLLEVQDSLCLSALTGEGFQELYSSINKKLEAVVPFEKYPLFIKDLHEFGSVKSIDVTQNGILLKAYTSPDLARKLSAVSL